MREARKLNGEQLELFEPGEVQTFKASVNPMIAAYGEGPEGAKCRTCKHFGYKQYANRYYKCGLRGKDGARTDHNFYWPACRKYEIAREAK